VRVTTSRKGASMRKWSHLPPIELFPSPFEYEFATLRVNATRRRTLNFELSADPHFDAGGPPEVG
jgi:hypothetical protein